MGASQNLAARCTARFWGLEDCTSSHYQIEKPNRQRERPFLADSTYSRESVECRQPPRSRPSGRPAPDRMQPVGPVTAVSATAEASHSLFRQYLLGVRLLTSMPSSCLHHDFAFDSY